MKRLRIHDRVTYTRVQAVTAGNEDVVEGVVYRIARKQKAVYIKQDKTEKIVAAPLDRVKKA